MIHLGKKLKVTIIDTGEESHEIWFRRNEYPNLMELIINTYYEEIGACRGRGLCGSCHVQHYPGILEDIITTTEMNTLNTLYDKKPNSRLACQIILNEKINEMVFTIIDSY